MEATARPKVHKPPTVLPLPTADQMVEGDAYGGFNGKCCILGWVARAYGDLSPYNLHRDGMALVAEIAREAGGPDVSYMVGEDPSDRFNRQVYNWFDEYAGRKDRFARVAKAFRTVAKRLGLTKVQTIPIPPPAVRQSGIDK